MVAYVQHLEAEDAGGPDVDRLPVPQVLDHLGGHPVRSAYTVEKAFSIF
jgi:hypothetical protein